MRPKLLKGKRHTDSRGSLTYNNTFDTSVIKRIYFIENLNQNTVRGWQGHKIEQRWFSSVAGAFKVKLIKIDDWINPSVSLVCEEFVITSHTLDVLYIPQGYVSSIQALENGSKLLVMADYLINEHIDEFRYDLNYFSN